ncbi:MAG: Tad domain-containing protein [Dehalococcoidia bacterium]
MLFTKNRRDQRDQHGQAVVLIAVMLAVIGGMAALAIDFSSYAADHRDLQNDADAVALAASFDLPDGSAATAAAESWATKNNIEAAEIESVEIIPQSGSEPNPKVRVTLKREHNFTFARLIGISSADVITAATAIKTSAAGGDGVVPLSVTAAAMNGVSLGGEVVLKYDARNIQNGNTSPIRIDGNGNGNCTSSDSYCDGVKFGSENAVCALGADPTYCDGPSVVDTQTGNLIGGTKRAIEYRLDNTDSRCNEFDEVFTDEDGTGTPDQDGDGIYRLTNECNPFTEGGYESLRVLIVPVIDGPCNGSCSVTIQDFALFFLEGFANGNNCTGNDCEIIGRFVRVNQNIGLLAGTFDPDSANSFIRLVE